jgi:hypothetical protein
MRGNPLRSGSSEAPWRAASWTYESKRKEYAEEAGTPWKARGESRTAQNGESDVLRQYEDFLSNRFRGLPKYIPVASFEKESWVKLGRDKVACYVVKVQTPELMHELWVDKNRFVILRFRQTPPRPQEGIAMQTTVTVSMSEANVNGELPESQFKFTPPEKATKVQSLTPTGKSH